MTHIYYKLDIQGIVYLVDPVTSIAYTYDLIEPTEIGKVVWTDIKTEPRIELRADWQAVLDAKFATWSMPAGH
jgi:hypothetical protein